MPASVYIFKVLLLFLLQYSDIGDDRQYRKWQKELEFFYAKEMHGARL